MPNVFITNPHFDDYTKAGKDYYKDGDDWYTRENERSEGRDEQSGILTALLIIQLLLYAAMWSNELDDLKKSIKKLKCLSKMTHRADIDIDYPIMKKKQEALYISIPPPEMCDDAKLYDDLVMCEAKGIDQKGIDYANETRDGIPDGWSINNGRSFGALSQSYTGSVLSNSSKRRMEQFQKNKLRLILSSQNASRMDLRPAIRDLNLSVGIHSKLADMYAQGFNSAGLGLGSILGQQGAV